MEMRMLGLLAAYMVLTASAANVNRALVPARATSKAELLNKCADGVSPVPTTRPKPELVEMELFKRTLETNNCGWYADFTCK